MTIKQQGGIFGRNPTFNNVTVDGDAAFQEASFNTTADGVVVDVQKNGTTVGGLGVDGGDLISGTGNTGFRFIDSSVAILPWDFAGNTNNNGAIDLGNSSNRFADIHLAGNVIIGTSGKGIDFSATSGSGTSELFDDYEEGTYDGSVYEVGGSTLITATGSYIKVGKVVTVSIQIGGGTTGGSGELRSDLPFPVSKYSSNTLAYRSGPALVAFSPATTYITFVDALGSISAASKMIGSDVGSGTRLYFNLTYITSS